VLSSGIDIIWRKRLLSVPEKRSTKLDPSSIATGTGDFCNWRHWPLNPVKSSEWISPKGMLAEEKKKWRSVDWKHNIELQLGWFRRITFWGYKFECSHVFHLESGTLKNSRKRFVRYVRVIESHGGKAVILEFKQATAIQWSSAYSFYSNTILASNWKTSNRKKNNSVNT